MDNQHKIGCRFGANDRTKIIDPNAFYGELDSSRNIPVRTEDLTISVKLTTTKKSRTTIATDDSGNKIVKEQKGATINFIEGSEINGKKVLTTKYTQLTTVFDKDEFNQETFGITNIDIDFNSSYTPIIKIDFIDVRGSSIFQNEEGLTEDNSKNKYTTFFEFPYPMFELEIKGYYGQPVTYCLHMTKFNSKFNSNTGNFEISCEFIGYTYALLSDMLVGFLKVIPLTTIGKSIFDSYNKEREDNGKPKLLTLGELRKKIAEISTEIQKVSENYEEAKIIKSFQDANNLLSSLNLNLNSLNDQFSIDKKPNSTEVSEYSFIILEDVPFSNEKNIKNNEINNEIKETVKKYNELKIEGLNISEIDFASPIMLTDLTLNKLEPDYDLQPFGPFKNLSEIESFKKDLKNYIKNNYDLASDKTFRAFDLRSRYKILNDQKSLVETSLKDANKTLAVKIKDDISVKLSFDPTVRNMIELFTNLIEVFMETIYTVSHQAEENIERRTLLQNIFGQDLKKSDYTQTINYWPWPDYREKDGKTNAYVDTYLGLAPELRNNISDINELVFIDELLQAFLTAKQEELKDNLLDTANETLFIPSNPLDTKVFGVNGNPYAKVDIIKTEQALRIFLIRAMTFLGYSNNQDYLTTGENGDIRTMAKLEAKMLYDALINPKVKGLFKYISLDAIVKTIGKISNDDRFVVSKTTTGDYTYNYVNKDNGLVDDFKLLPIGYDINGEDLEIPYQNEPAALTYLKQEKLREYASSGKLFLTNYGAGLNVLGSDSIDNNKFYDGGIYISIKSQNDIIPEATQNFYDENLSREMTLNLKSLEDNQIESAGFNSFGGSYGVPDFNKINFGEGVSVDTPSMYVFYKNDSWNGLALSREASGKNLVSNYDFNKTKILVGKSYSYSKINDILLDSTSKNRLHLNIGKNRELASSINTDSVSYPYINQYLDSSYKQSVSLFGSIFYYQQSGNLITKNDGSKIYDLAERYVRGLLFLNTLPFNTDEGNNNDPFIKSEIKHLFDVKAGFIHAPKLWVAYVGGLLWWLSKQNPYVEDGKILSGGRGIEDPINWKSNLVESNGFWVSKPSLNQYLPKNLLKSAENISEDSLLLNMPLQVQEEFKKVFFDFIDGTGETSFNNIKSKLEIYQGTTSNFINLINNLTESSYSNNNSLISNGYINFSIIQNNFNNYDKYKIFLPIQQLINVEQDKYRFIFLELDDKSDVVSIMKKAFSEELIIVNTGYKIWKPNKYQQYRQGISVKKDIFEEYVNTFVTEIKNLTEDYTIQGEEEKQLSEVFGSKNKDTIKLMLYKYCKNIYDKWIGGVTDINNIIFQCGDNSRTDSNRTQTDTELAKKYGSGKPRLIDSFRFVTRSFRDIGDELFIDPRPIEEQISDFPNTSSYSVISGLLNDNKFEFHALPTFINFKDDKMLESVFTPQEYGNSITSCGPTFVCVYTGQHSKSLDISSGRYPNDGFDMRCDSTTIPDDFKNALESHEDPIAVFEVNYSQQNQNIFKNISLDQSEFSETEESLKIIQDISMNGFENKPTYAGQNMYNIYGVRSYSAEIEMLGNPMIQPMMYFQLNNIPMFHGAYMIIRTRHNIKPNHMTTWFTGTRIRAVETPLIDVTEAYMSLVETLDLSDVKGSATSVRSTGGMIFGQNCGEFKLTKPIVDGAEGFYKSKPIRDLVAIVESRGDYNAYNNGIAGSKGSGNYTPSQMTVSQIKSAQAKTGNDRIFAVGKYQLIPKTFNTMVKTLGFSDNTVFNAENQEKAGEWLILKGAGYRNGLINYFKTGSLGTEKDLQNAITDLALEFASFPTYYGITTSQASSRVNPIGYNSKTALYGGSAGNAASAVFCAYDVAKALIETWKNYNPNKTPEFTLEKLKSVSTIQIDNDNSIKITSNDKSIAIIMGDSTVGVINSVPNGLQKNKIDISFNKVGENVNWLVTKLKEFGKDGKKYGNTKYVFVSIGTNDGYVISDSSKKKISELNELIKKIYPNAKRVVVPGTYGWGNVANKTKQNQDDYYKIFTDLGFIYQYPNANALANTDAKAHDSKSDWFVKSTKQIVDIKNS